MAALQRLGGVAGTRQLFALSSRRKLETAVRRGEIRRIARGRYVLTESDRHRRAPVRQVEVAGVTSHLSAAQHWGWAVKWPPSRPWVTVPRNRKVPVETQAVVEVVYANLGADDIVDSVTSPVRTVLDCARRLPFDEALPVADSALRSGHVTRDRLIRAAKHLRGRGATQARRVAAEASGLAANPFESVLRALVLECPELSMRPQAPVVARGYTLHPDLVDERLRVVIEADSWEFHTSKDAHARDCVRYTALAVEGWTVVRFNWEQVLRSPAYVRDVLADLAVLPREVGDTRRAG